MNKKQIASYNDNRLLQIAFYHVTRGMLCAINDPQQVMERFIEFKGLVLRGESTLDQLENKVFGDFGIQNGDDKEQMIHKMMEAVSLMTQENLENLEDLER